MAESTRKPKKIGIDARFLGDAGPGRYIKNILEQLELIDKQNKYYIFLRDKGYNIYEPKSQNFVKVSAEYTWYSFEEQILFLFKILGYKLDLFYVPHFNIPILYPKKIVTAIPDLIMHTFSTERGTTLPKWYFKIKKLVYKVVVWWAVLRSSKIIVPSNDVMHDFNKVFPYVNRSKYVLAYEGVDPVFSDKFHENSHMETLNTLDKNSGLVTEVSATQYLLYISSMYEHKNVPRLLEAFKLLKDKYGYPGSLVLIGKKDNFSSKIRSIADSMGLSDSVFMPGQEKYVTDQEINELRKRADAYVFATLKEGFSLTPLEAQQNGLVCIISDIPVHREIYRDSVMYFDPMDPEHIALKINTVLKSPKLSDDLVSKGYENVKRFSWNETALITLEVFKETLGIEITTNQ